jgi:hypothetical protein
MLLHSMAQSQAWWAPRLSVNETRAVDSLRIDATICACATFSTTITCASWELGDMIQRMLAHVSDVLQPAT